MLFWQVAHMSRRDTTPMRGSFSAHGAGPLLVLSVERLTWTTLRARAWSALRMPKRTLASSASGRAAAADITRVKCLGLCQVG